MIQGKSYSKSRQTKPKRPTTELMSNKNRKYGNIYRTSKKSGATNTILSSPKRRFLFASSDTIARAQRRVDIEAALDKAIHEVYDNRNKKEITRDVDSTTSSATRSTVPDWNSVGDDSEDENGNDAQSFDNSPLLRLKINKQLRPKTNLRSSSRKEDQTKPKRPTTQSRHQRRTNMTLASANASKRKSQPMSLSRYLQGGSKRPLFSEKKDSSRKLEKKNKGYISSFLGDSRDMEVSSMVDLPTYVDRQGQYDHEEDFKERTSFLARSFEALERYYEDCS